jgi:hypothetical protein
MTTQALQRYFDELRVRLAVVAEVKKEVDRLFAPDFNPFRLIWMDELRLSNVIANLLDPKASHGQGRRFLDAFLDQLSEKLAEKKPLQNLQKAWAECDGIVVETEATTTNSRRMDILIHDHSAEPHALMIENKPYASDQDRQLQDYADHLKKYAKTYVMVYLSGDGKPPSEQSLAEDEREQMKQAGHLITLAYGRDLVAWLRQCKTIAEADHVRWILDDFTRYIEDKFADNQQQENGR